MESIAFPRRGGVGRSLGSDRWKGGQKKKSSKRGPKAKKVNKKKENKEKMRLLNERKAQFAERKAMDDRILGTPSEHPDHPGRRERDGLVHSVLNPTGKTRTFEQNLCFLTLFSELYERRGRSLAE